MHTRQGRTSGYLNKSQGCLNEAVKKEARSGTSVKSERNMSRKSTSDLTELNDADTEVTILSSPRRRGSMKGGLGEDELFSFMGTTFCRKRKNLIFIDAKIPSVCTARVFLSGRNKKVH